MQSRLDAYSAVSKSVARRRWGRWETYAAGGGAALAMTAGATASIIWSGIQNLTVSVGEAGSNFGNNAGLNIDIDGTGFAGNLFALNLSNHRSFSTWKTGTFTGPYSSNYITTGTSTFSTRSVYAGLAAPGSAAIAGSGAIAKLNSGAVISSGGSFVGSGVLRNKYSSSGFVWSSSGNFPSQGDGFAGVRFQQAGQTHYGWIHFSFSDTNNDGWLDQITATDWAYENVAGGSILAGQTTGAAVPEPGSMSLSVLALGSVGVLALRRRRKAHTQPPAASQES